MKSLFYFYQNPDTSNDEYLKEFKAREESLDHFDACTLGKFPCLVKKNSANYTTNRFCEHELKTSEEVVKKEVMAALLLSGADILRYGGLKSTLAQHLSMGINQYPRTVDETLNIINTYHKTTKGSPLPNPTKVKLRLSLHKPILPRSQTIPNVTSHVTTVARMDIMLKIVPRKQTT